MAIAEPTTEAGLWPRVKAITGWPQPDETRIADLSKAWRSGARLFTEAADLDHVNQATQLWPDGVGDAFVQQATATLEAAAKAGEDMTLVADRTEAFGLEVTAVKNGIRQTIEANVELFALAGRLPLGLGELAQDWFVDQVAGYVTDLIDESAQRIREWAPANLDELGAPTWLDDLGNSAANAGVDLLEGVFSIGQAALDNPAALAGIVLGGGLAVVSGGGVAVGVGGSATGVGAIPGVPLIALSAAGVATGVTLAGASVAAIAESAANNPVNLGTWRPRETTKTGVIARDHLTPKDLDGARREAAGEVVATKGPGGKPYDHVHEVRDAQRGLANRIKELKQTLKDSRTTPSQAEAAEQELSEASRMLDYSEKFLPR